MIKSIMKRGIARGAALATISTAVTMVASAVKSKSPFAGLNATATALKIGGKRAGDRFDKRATPAGLAISSGVMLISGIAYEAALAATRMRPTILSGVAFSLANCAVARLAMPKHTRENVREKIGRGGMAAKYIAVAIASACGSKRK